jgi:hypothetical protein
MKVATKKFSGCSDSSGASLFLFLLFLIVASSNNCCWLSCSWSVDGFGLSVTHFFHRRTPQRTLRMTHQNLLESDADAYNAIFSSSVELSGSYVRNGALMGRLDKLGIEMGILGT